MANSLIYSSLSHIKYPSESQMDLTGGRDLSKARKIPLIVNSDLFGYSVVRVPVIRNPLNQDTHLGQC